MINSTQIKDHIKRNIGKYAVGGLAAAGVGAAHGIDALDNYHNAKYHQHAKTMIDLDDKAEQFDKSANSVNNTTVKDHLLGVSRNLRSISSNERDKFANHFDKQQEYEKYNILKKLKS